jgi:Cu+-exporting ATPase
MFGLFSKVKDPVCKMKLDKKQVNIFYTYKGKTYYFCSVNCKEKFELNPKKYVYVETSSSGGCCH